MTYEIDAIYNNGAFVPVVPLAIPEGVRVHLRVDEPATPVVTDGSGEEPKQSRAAMDDFLRRMAELPIESPDDGFSVEDHDKLIYTLP
jgi:predicted DNA-binding antitoxin AbrB/MazE fold protein